MDGRTVWTKHLFTAVSKCHQPMVAAISSHIYSHFTQFPFLQPIFPVALLKETSRRDACSLQQLDCFPQLFLSHSYKHRYDEHANAILRAILFLSHEYRYAPHNDVSVNDGPHIRRWSHNILIHYRVADKSLARPDWKTIERSPFFVRRGGRFGRGHLVGRTTFWNYYEWLARVRFWSL
jgi:hypothetical protein